MPDTITREDTLNGRLYDDAIVRGVHNLRFREDLVRRAVARLRKHDSEFLDKLAVILVRMSDKDMERVGSSLSLNRATDRTKALVMALRDFGASSTETAMFAADELRELAFDEAEFWAERVNHHMPDAAGIRVDAPKKSAVNSAWANTLLAGESITDSIKRWGKQRAEIMRSVIRQQAYEGVEATAIIRGLAGRRGFLARNRDGSPNGLGLKLRTATPASQSAGQKMFAAENDLINDLVWVATIDLDTSDTCTARHGRLVNKELEGRLPPAHPNCLPGDSLVAPCGLIAGISKRWFDGETITIHASTDRPLTVTPNHPVLTQRGWVAAQSVNVGDKVAYSGFSDGASMSASGDNKNLVTRFDDLYEALLCSGKMVAMPMPSTAEDFHGDGTDNQINEILIHKDFALEGDAATRETGFDEVLIDGHTSGAGRGLGFMSLDDFVMRNFSTSRRSVSGIKHSGASDLVSVTPSNVHYLTSASDACVSVVQDCPYDSHGNIVPFCDAGHTFAANVSPHNCLGVSAGDVRRTIVSGAFSDNFNAIVGKGASNNFVCHAVASGDALNCFASEVAGLNVVDQDVGAFVGRQLSDCDTSAGQNGSNGRYAYPETLSQVNDVFPSGVSFNDVTLVERNAFSGHVYNLQTTTGFYHAEEVIVHNCRSITVPGVYNIAAAKRLKKRLPADALDIEGRIPEHETAGKWLARQTEEVQRKVLGPQRLGLYKAGRMKWPEDFLRRDDGHRWTIDELRKRNADFFKT